jgi:hypothetical protein
VHLRLPDGTRCRVPAELCEVDHAIPVDDGGETTQENGRLRCPRHHSDRQRFQPWLAAERAARRATRRAAEPQATAAARQRSADADEEASVVAVHDADGVVAPSTLLHPTSDGRTGRVDPVTGAGEPAGAEIHPPTGAPRSDHAPGPRHPRDADVGPDPPPARGDPAAEPP